MIKAVEGFTFFRSYLEAVREMPDDVKLEVLTAIITYGLDGSEPSLSIPISRAIFSIARPSLDSSRDSVLNGKKGGRPKKKDPLIENGNPPFENSESTKTIDKDLDKDKDCILDADKPPYKKSTRFVAPSVAEVKAYCDERENGIDPEKFVDFYEARGWMAGKSKLKDWKAAVRTWEKGGKDDGQDSTSGLGKRKNDNRWAGYELGGIKLD